MCVCVCVCACDISVCACDFCDIVVHIVTMKGVTSPPGAGYVETTGIKWCSGGGDWAPGDNVFGAGVNGLCPLLPSNWTDAAKVTACEQLCSTAEECTSKWVVRCVALGRTKHYPTGF